MKTRPLNFTKIHTVVLTAVVLLTVCIPVHAGEAESSIGAISSFSGEVLVRTQGAWGGKPVPGLPLFSGDKVVAVDGTAELSFLDGTRLVMCRSSVLEIKQWTDKGLPIIKSDLTRRRFTLFMGKIWIDTDYDKMRTEVATPSLTVGLRGDDGDSGISVIVSIDKSGDNYLSFDQGARGFTLGEWEPGIADNLNPKLARRRQFLLNAQLTDLAFNVAQNLDSSENDDPVPQALKDLAWARAKSSAAKDATFCSKFLLQWNADRVVLADAKDSFRLFSKYAEAFEKAEKAAIEGGATEDQIKELFEKQNKIKEDSLAVAGLEMGAIGEPEAMDDESSPLDALEDFGQPMPGSFAGMDPCM